MTFLQSNTECFTGIRGAISDRQLGYPTWIINGNFGLQSACHRGYFHSLAEKLIDFKAYAMLTKVRMKWWRSSPGFRNGEKKHHKQEFLKSHCSHFPSSHVTCPNLAKLGRSRQRSTLPGKKITDCLDRQLSTQSGPSSALCSETEIASHVHRGRELGGLRLAAMDDRLFSVL
ncbi:hypothetical protein IFU00_19395 [Oxalobacteraceae sp. CFBP 8761]|nr:hypothetical protein [Oxalobacteraceae sp. CFBP 8761]